MKTDKAFEFFLPLQESVFALVILVLLGFIFLILKMVFSHIKDSDKRWSETVSNNTKALQDISKAHEMSGDKIAMSIERALMHGTKHTTVVKHEE